MILTGKAKEAFLKRSIGKEIALFEAMLPIYQHALIIEWLDSVGIYISTEYIYGDHFSCCVETLEQTTFTKGDTRQQATEKAIEKANEIYNEKHK